MIPCLARHPPRTRVAHLDKIFFDEGRSYIEFKAASDRYLVINRLPPAPIDESASDNGSQAIPSPPNCALNPPLHWHSGQEEFFHVLEGKAAFYLEGRKCIATTGEVVKIPEGAYHTFRNASSKDDLVVEFVLEPRNVKRDEEFFSMPGTLTNRADAGMFTDELLGNTQTYRDDCKKAGIPRSMFQVLLFNYRANVVLALPGPQFVARPLGLLLNFFGAWIGRLIFGFQDSYPEYYDGKAEAHRR
jgi:mannose-6-phosphate isomerase-like protein (cupin superfamily)